MTELTGQPAEPIARLGLGAPFWRLFVSSTTSNLSDGVVLAALPLLAATLTRDPVAISLLASLAFLPWLLVALPAGALVDRTNRRTAMALANVLRALVLALLAVAVLTGMATMPLLYTVSFLLGCAETVYDNAGRAMLPAVVERRQLERGNSLLSTGESVGNIFLGAPVGAWLFAIAAVLPLWGNAIAYLLAAALIVTVRGQFRTHRSEPTSMRADMAGAVRWLFRHRVLRALLLTTAATGLLHSMTNGVLVLFVLQNLGLSEQGYGILLAVGGVGAVVGSLLSPWFTARLGRSAAMGLSEIVAAGALLLIGLVQTPVVAMVGFAFSAASVSMFNVQVMSVRQALIPAAMFGRVQGAYRTLLWGGMPVGMLAGGAIGSWLGLPAVFVIAGAGSFLTGAATWLVVHRARTQISAAFESDPARLL